MTTPTLPTVDSTTTHVIDDAANQRSVIDEKILDATVPGVQIEFTPDEAQYAGAFSEDALTEQDAMASQIDAQTLTLADEESHHEQ